MEIDNYQILLGKSSFHDSLKLLEADIHHANALANAIPKAKGGGYLEMKLVYNEFTPLFFFLLQWLHGSCFFSLYYNLFHILIYEVNPDGRRNLSTEGSKATIRDFYASILPSLKRLHNDMVEQETTCNLTRMIDKRKNVSSHGRCQSTSDREREDECGICLVPTTKMVLPGCCHEMCINCYRNWNTKSESCPFCRSGLRRVKSEDLWVLTSESEILDIETVLEQELSRFYKYIQSLPKDIPEEIPFWVYFEYLI